MPRRGDEAHAEALQFVDGTRAPPAVRSRSRRNCRRPRAAPPGPRPSRACISRPPACRQASPRYYRPPLRAHRRPGRQTAYGQRGATSSITRRDRKKSPHMKGIRCGSAFLVVPAKRGPRRHSGSRFRGDDERKMGRLGSFSRGISRRMKLSSTTCSSQRGELLSGRSTELPITSRLICREASATGVWQPAGLTRGPSAGGTLQSSTRCSSAALLPRRSSPVLTTAAGDWALSPDEATRLSRLVEQGETAGESECTAVKPLPWRENSRHCAASAHTPLPALDARPQTRDPSPNWTNRTRQETNGEISTGLGR